MSISFTLNGQDQTVEAPEDTPILWVIRDYLKLTGTKFGCGMALCGACTVHLDGKAIRACVTPISVAKDKSVTTIEGLNSRQGQAVQQAWEELAVVQCGYCQSGQIMSATSLLTDNANPSDDEINQAMAGNICRCSTYHRIKKAVKHAAENLA